MMSDLAGTSRERDELLALLNLWKSLDRPKTGFWRHTKVFVNRAILEGVPTM